MDVVAKQDVGHHVAVAERQLLFVALGANVTHVPTFLSNILVSTTHMTHHQKVNLKVKTTRTYKQK
jgi:hypothetical protein